MRVSWGVRSSLQIPIRMDAIWTPWNLGEPDRRIAGTRLAPVGTGDEGNANAESD